MKSKEEILLQLNSVVDRLRKKNLVNVTRENVIEGAIRAFHRRSSDPCAGLHVKFGGEDGIDDGGLTREFMRLLKKGISQHPIFVGKDGSKMLAVHAPAFDKGFYKVAGQMLAYMMVHKGPTPNFLDPFLYGALCRGLHNVKSEVCNVQDVDIREQLQKIAASTTANEFYEAVEPLECIVRVSGNASLLGKPDQRNQLVKALCQYLVIENVKPAYDQFSEGLASLGLLTAIKEHGDTIKPFFVYNEKKLTADDILVLYQVSLMAMSEEGSNRRKKEDATVSWWRDMVLDMEEEGTKASFIPDWSR